MPNPEIVQEFLDSHDPPTSTPAPPAPTPLHEVLAGLRVRADAVLTQPDKPLHGLLLDILHALESQASAHYELAARVAALDRGQSVSRRFFHERSTVDDAAGLALPPDFPLGQDPV